MTTPLLTHNAVEQMIRTNDGNKNSKFQPILQLLNVKALPNSMAPSNGSAPPPPDRFRMILSDGVHFVQCMIGSSAFQQDPASQPMLSSMDQIQPNSYVQIVDYMPKSISGRIVVILFNFRVVYHSTPTEVRVGAPIDIDKTVGIIDDLRTVDPGATTSSANPQPLYNSTNVNTATNTAHNVYKTVTPSPVRSNNPYGQSSTASTSNAPIVRNPAMATSSHVTPISALNMYHQRWTIQARVTNKSEIRTWSNSRGEGSLFSVDLLDSSGTDIRATFFKEAVDKFYSLLQVSSIYTFTGGRLKVANMQYNTCKSNFEITFDQNAEIHLQADTGAIAKQTYDFIPQIAQLENINANQTVDILAIVKSVGTVSQLMSKKSGQELTKCDITLIDDSNTEINLTVWGSQAEKAPLELVSTNPNEPMVVAIRRGRVSDYGGKSLSSSSGGGIDINPDVPEVQRLVQWWHRVGRTGSVPGKALSTSMGGMAGKVESLLERKDITSIKEQNLGYNEKPDWVSVKGTCTFIKRDKEGGAWYPACPTTGDPCRNLFKVTQTPDGQWFCDKCNNYYVKPVRRWIFSAVIEDTSGSTWVSFFNEQAEKLLHGSTADEAYGRAYESSGDGSFDTDAYESIFATSLYTEYIFKCKVKNEISPEGESRVKTSVYNLYPIDYLKESNDILAALEKM